MNEFRSFLETVEHNKAELEQLRNRRDKIEERRDQVRREIYDKLSTEYDTKIREGEQSLDSAAESLRKSMTSMKSELDALTGVAEKNDLAIEELELRKYIGEYESEQDFQGKLEAEKSKRSDLKARLTELQDQLARAESVLGNSTVAGAAPPLVITDTQPLPAQVSAAGDGTHPSAGPALDETIDIRGVDELSSTVAAPGNGNPLPVFGDPNGLEAGGTDRDASGHGDAPSAAVTINYLNQTREVRIEGYPFTIGRSTKNTLSLKSEEISRYHAQIRFEKGAFVLEDLGSANGTKLNGKRIQRAELKPGGLIGLGPAEITFTLSSG